MSNNTTKLFTTEDLKKAFQAGEYFKEIDLILELGLTEEGEDKPEPELNFEEWVKETYDINVE